MNQLQSESTEHQGMIITDDFAIEPVLDFNAYADTIVDIIKNSYPNFSIGIYGEWGTGKTTLMKQVESKLKENESIVTVWFNAWRYEREEQFALIPLLKKIAYSLPDKKEFAGLKESLKKGISIVRKNLGQIFTSVVSDFIRQKVGENTQKVVTDISNQLIPRIELLTEVNEKDTIYFDGLDNIEEEIYDLGQRSQPVRIVVFIDDLDRCSPKKALEVFESVKVFLGVNGFIYVLGLSHETISKLITAEYIKSEIKGDQYIKKLIQIPITLPEWSTKDVSTLIGDLVKNGFITKKYVELINDNKDSIAEAVENNPREVKRFINNFIVAHEILLRYNRKVDAKEFLLVQAINVRWNMFFRFLVKSTPESRKELEIYVGMSEPDRNKELEVDTSEKNLNLDFKRLLRNFQSDFELWNFLKTNSKIIFGIQNWETYRRAVESVSEIPTVSEIPRYKSAKRKSDLLLRISTGYSDLHKILSELIINPDLAPVSVELKRILDNSSAASPKIHEALVTEDKLQLDILLDDITEQNDSVISQINSVMNTDMIKATPTLQSLILRLQTLAMKVKDDIFTLTRGKIV